MLKSMFAIKSAGRDRKTKVRLQYIHFSKIPTYTSFESLRIDSH